MSVPEGVYVPIMFAEPTEEAVKPAVQVAVPVAPGCRVHGEPVNMPPAVPVFEKVTVPDGLVAVPGFDGLSLTVAVQVEAWPVPIELGLQETVVVVGRGLTVIVAAVLVLEEWVKSPPYWPMTEAVPVAVPEKFAVQVDVPVVAPADKAQLAVRGVILPVPVKLTIPFGVVGVPEVSVTVTVHVDPWLTIIGLSQETPVVVG